MGETSDTVADEMLLAQLVEPTFEGDDQISSPNNNSKAKIQGVPAFLRQNPYITKYWTPKIISFGPIHHRNQSLKQGEQFKIKWASLYIGEYSKKTSNQSPKEAAKFLLGILQDNIGELKKLFSEDVIEVYNDKELARVLFVDGCSLLYYMDKVDDHHPQALKLKLDQLMFTWREIMLLENQIPRTVLELLSKENGADLEFLMFNIREMGLAKRLGITMVGLQDKPKPFHILDSHRYIDMESVKNDVSNKEDHGGDDELHFWQTYKNLKDLKTVGIRVKANKREEWEWYKVSFTSGWFSGELRLPGIVINDATPYLFQNLIAHEMCPDFPNNFEFCSYFSFMDSIIDDAEDVKELRSAGVIQNLLGSDEEVAQLFNQIGHGLPSKIFNHMVRTDLVAYSNKYIQVKRQIEKHYSNRWKTWLAQARNTYFNTPWSLIAFLAALLALVLTFIQTWYAIHSK